MAAGVLLLRLDASGEDPAIRQLYRAHALRVESRMEELGKDVLGRAWDFGRPDRANVTCFSDGVNDVDVSERRTLTFTAAAEKVWIGWGNVTKDQPLSKRVWVPWGWTLEMQVRQSTDDVSTWAFQLLDGGVALPEAGTALLHGKGPHRLRFPVERAIRREDFKLEVPDGIRMEIAGPKGNDVEILSFGFYREVHDGHFRKTFDLPDVPVWRAVVNVSQWVTLSVNGRVLDFENSVFRRPTSGGGHYDLIPFDIAPYLRRGRNCVALRAQKIGGPPLVYLQGQAIPVTGDAIRLDTNETWRHVSQAGPGWDAPDYDDSAWAAARMTPPPYEYLRYRLPADDGILVLENPADPKLFFDAADPVRVRLRMPAGLAAKRPAVPWQLQRVAMDGEHDLASGRLDEFRVIDDSLVSEMDCGRLEPGVYAVQAAVRIPGGPQDPGVPEPFIVLGRAPITECDGDRIEDGMELTLEDTIDFTNPGDPHPWVEGYRKDGRSGCEPVDKPRIVERNGMTYRETGPGRSSFFGYRLEFKRPGDFYLMVLEYPDDAERWIGVSCSTSEKMAWTRSKAGPSIWTGDKYPLTGAIQEHHWIFRADVGPHTIDIISMQEGSPAAAARLRTYHIRDLPAIRIPKAGSRRLGILTERTTLDSGFGKTFGMNLRRPFHGMEEELRPSDADPSPLRPRLRWLASALDACEHYARYLRFTGQNLHAMGCFQYSENNTPFAPAPACLGSRIPGDLRDIAARVFERHGIDFVASIEYSGHMSLVQDSRISDSQVAAGAETLRAVSRDGHQMPGRIGGSYDCWNFVHPQVQGPMAQVAADILDKFKDRPNFRGLNWTAYLTGEWLPNFPDPDDASPFTHSYDDTTIRLFEKETGHVVPVDPKDPQRFQKRFVSLTAEPLRTPWTEWRGRKVRDFFAQVRDLVRQARPGLDLFVSPYINVSHARQWSLAQAASSGPSEAASIQSYLRNRGYDPAIFQPLDGLWLTRWTHATVKYAPLSHEPAYAAGWRQNLDDEFIRLYDHPERRAVMIMHHWDENSYAAPGAKPVTLRTSETWELTLPDGTEWPVAGNRGRLHAQPCGDFAREAFMQALVTSDPLQLLFGFVDVNLLVGNEQSLRDFARVFRSLPVSPSRPALGTSLKTDLAIREWPRPDGLFFAVANPCPWPIEGRVAVSGVERILALPSEKAAMTAPEGDSQAVTMRLVPFGVRAFRAEGPQAARLVSWRAAPVDGKSLDHLRRLIDGGKKTLNTPESASSLSAADTAFLREATSQAESALHEGKHALAWQTVTGWRYWTLLKKPAGRGM